MSKIKKKCVCCGAGFGSGQDYGYEWCEISLDDLIEGLCEFCNPNNKTWYIKDGLPCCRVIHIFTKKRA